MSTTFIPAAIGALFAGPLARILAWRGAVTRPPRTSCPGCGRTATWTATMPFTGRCPACRTASGPAPLIPELLTATGFVIAAGTGGPLTQTLALCWLAVFATALALIDAAVKRLPDKLTAPAFAGTTGLLIAAALQLDQPGTVLRILLAATALGSTYLALALAGGMGLGDVKLALTFGGALGYFGWNAVLFGTAAAFGFGAIFVALRRLAGRSMPERTIPFGPFIALGAFAALLGLHM